jgi:hypothetical protein
MLRSILFVGLASLSGLPSIAQAALFRFNPYEEINTNIDEVFEFGGAFEAIDWNSDGFITTEEVDYFSVAAMASATRYVIGADIRTGGRGAVFDITHKLGEPLVRHLSFSYDYEEVPCATDRARPDVLDGTAYYGTTFTSGSEGSEMTYYATWRSAGSKATTCKSYHGKTWSFGYDFQAGVTQFGDATPGPTVVATPLPASGLLFLTLLGASGFALRKARSSDAIASDSAARPNRVRGVQGAKTT